MNLRILLRSGRLTSACLLVFLSCHNDQEINLQETHGPLTLEQVFNYKSPYDLYSQAYSAFVFDSTAQLVTADEHGPVAKTTLKKNEGGDYQLTRSPLYQGPELEIRLIAGKAYIRATGKPSFFRTRNQAEFDRLRNVAFQEVLTAFQSAHFDGNGALKDSLFCVTQEAGEFCTDPNTGLPVKGLLNTKTADGMPMRVSFRLEPQASKTVVIQTP